jgi:hypothetical protein
MLYKKTVTTDRIIILSNSNFYKKLNIATQFLDKTRSFRDYICIILQLKIVVKISFYLLNHIFVEIENPV